MKVVHFQEEKLIFSDYKVKNVGKKPRNSDIKVTFFWEKKLFGQGTALLHIAKLVHSVFKLQWTSLSNYTFNQSDWAIGKHLWF